MRAIRPGFTLIEILVVMIVLGMMAGLVVLSLGGTMDRYQLSRAAETLEKFDAGIRRQARLSETPRQATIYRRDGRLVASAASQFSLPRSVQIESIRRGNRSLRQSQFVIDVTGDGHSDSYAVQLRCGNRTQWILFLGASGQPVTLDDERKVDAFLSM